MQIENTFIEVEGCSRPLLNQEAYFGAIESIEDATLVVDAARKGKLPRVKSRLVDRERRAIRHGSVFVFSESESRIRRWTDGKAWSPSRITGEFLVYKELSGSHVIEPMESINAAVNVTPVIAPKLTFDATTPENLPSIASKQLTSPILEGGLCKKTISLGVGMDAFHLVAYYRDGPEKADLIAFRPTLNLFFDQFRLAKQVNASNMLHPINSTEFAEGLKRRASATFSTFDTITKDQMSLHKRRTSNRLTSQRTVTPTPQTQVSIPVQQSSPMADHFHLDQKQQVLPGLMIATPPASMSSTSSGGGSAIRTSSNIEEDHLLFSHFLSSLYNSTTGSCAGCNVDPCNNNSSNGVCSSKAENRSFSDPVISPPQTKPLLKAEPLKSSLV